ncbi:MAG TPA: hypothetical protein P5136_05785, partial [Methanofastidiosum sp.]|nr:hypothetical protein [Methanofastidiosum sp.]
DFNELKKNFADFIFYNSNFKLYHSPLIKIYSKPRESKSDFILRITQMARERRDEEVDKIEEKYSKDLQKLKEKLERSQEVLLKKQATANSLKQEAMVSAGESVIKIFMGRRSTTSASKAMNKYQKSKTVAIDIQEAQKDIETLNKEMELLENKLKIEVESIKERREKEISEIKEVLIQPKKSDIEVKIVSLAWIPYWEITYKKEGKLNTEIIPGYL